MLASEAPIALPALLFDEGDEYDAIVHAEGLRAGGADAKNGLIGCEIVDSSGQRFRITAFVNLERRGPPWKRWIEDRFWGWIFSWPTYRFDLELEPMAWAPFEDTLRRVIAREIEACELWVADGGGADSPAFTQGLQQCQSIADIIRHIDPLVVGLRPLSRPPAPR